jgi:hypothetical protein
MRKLILTLFLASASLVSFAQSTVKTIRVANATTNMTVDLPTGTVVVDVANKDLYVATASVSLIGFGGTAPYNLTNGFDAGVFVKVNGSVYSVIKEVVAATGATTAVTLTETPDGALVTIANTDFKVYVNGSLLTTTAYAYTTSPNVVTITSDFYEFDQVSVVYNTIK